LLIYASIGPLVQVCFVCQRSYLTICYVFFCIRRLKELPYITKHSTWYRKPLTNACLFAYASGTASLIICQRANTNKSYTLWTLIKGRRILTPFENTLYNRRSICIARFLGILPAKHIVHTCRNRNRDVFIGDVTNTRRGSGLDSYSWSRLFPVILFNYN